MMQVEFRGQQGLRGALYLDADRIRNLTRLVPAFISITSPFDHARPGVEGLIEETYRRAYGSRISKHYPSLMSVHDEDERTLAAVGFRSAADGSLFLEQYLDEPVEHALSAVTKEDVCRDEIIEIGSLASAGRGASVFLFVALAAYLKELGFRFATVTATDSLRRAFEFFGFEPITLGAADCAALADSGASWGSYYAHNPQVMAGAIAPCFSKLEQFLPAERNCGLPHLLTRRTPVAKEIFV